MEIDDRFLLPQLPPHYPGETKGPYHRERHDVVRPEPIVALPFVQHNLERSQSQRQQSESYIIQLHAAERSTRQIGRIVDQLRRQDQRKNSYRNIDEEDPAPTVVVRNPA